MQRNNMNNQATEKVENINTNQTIAAIVISFKDENDQIHFLNRQPRTQGFNFTIQGTTQNDFCESIITNFKEQSFTSIIELQDTYAFLGSFRGKEEFKNNDRKKLFAFTDSNNLINLINSIETNNVYKSLINALTVENLNSINPIEFNSETHTSKTYIPSPISVQKAELEDYINSINSIAEIMISNLEMAKDIVSSKLNSDNEAEIFLEIAKTDFLKYTESKSFSIKSKEELLENITNVNEEGKQILTKMILEP